LLTSPTFDKLRGLSLTGMAAALTEQLEQPSYQELSFLDRLGLLVDREVSDRDNRRLERHLKAARLRISASVEDVDFRHPRGLDRATLLNLAESNWVAAHRNLLVTGPTGLGKTYLACALAHAAIRRGHTALYLRAPRLFGDLAVAHADGRFPRLTAAWARVDVLVIDDLALQHSQVSLANSALDVQRGQVTALLQQQKATEVDLQNNVKAQAAARVVEQQLAVQRRSLRIPTCTHEQVCQPFGELAPLGVIGLHEREATVDPLINPRVGGLLPTQERPDVQCACLQVGGNGVGFTARGASMVARPLGIQKLPDVRAHLVAIEQAQAAFGPPHGASLNSSQPGRLQHLACVGQVGLDAIGQEVEIVAGLLPEELADSGHRRFGVGQRGDRQQQTPRPPIGSEG